MKLLAGSLNVEVDTFLHAGYLSAGGRPFDEMGDRDLVRATTTLIDVKQSLQLQDNGTTSDQTALLTTAEIPPAAPTPVRASLAGEGFLAGIVILFFGLLTLYYWRRLSCGNRPRWLTLAFVAVPLVLIAVGAIGVYSLLPLYEARQLNNHPPPWVGVPRQEYVDPKAATEAIMQALVANALPGCRFNVQQLGAIRHEVTFPLPVEQWTPGMAYAAQTYGIDGWGREFAFQPLSGGRYRIASAGPDSEHGTDDDIVLLTSRRKTYDWEQLVNGVYVRRVEGQYAYFVHRIGHRNFQMRRLVVAREMTGTDVFDMLRFHDLHRWEEKGVEQNPVVAQLDRHRLRGAGEPVDADPLFFVQITRADDG